MMNRPAMMTDTQWLMILSIENYTFAYNSTAFCLVFQISHYYISSRTTTTCTVYNQCIRYEDMKDMFLTGTSQQDGTGTIRSLPYNYGEWGQDQDYFWGLQPGQNPNPVWGCNWIKLSCGAELKCHVAVMWLEASQKAWLLGEWALVGEVATTGSCVYCNCDTK